MSELTDLVISVGELFGWGFVLLIVSVYQLYCPQSIHPHGGTKLQRLLTEIPEPIAVILESLAEEIDKVDEDAVADILHSNGYTTDDFKESDGKPPIRPADDD